MSLAVPVYSEEDAAVSLLDAIRSPWWRVDSTDTTRLIAKFGEDRRVEIPLQARLKTGVLLSSLEATVARNSIVDFLCVQGIPRLAGGRASAELTEERKLVTACRVIDGLLIRDATGKLARLGLQAVTDSDLTAVLLAAARSPRSNLGIYDWHTRLAKHLREEIKSLSEEAFTQWCKRHPDILVLPPKDECELELSQAELIRSRALIYQRATENFGPFRVLTAIRQRNVLYAFKRAIYQDTLLGASELTHHLVFPTELRLVNDHPVRREHAAVPVSIALEDVLAGQRTVEKYRKSMLTAGVLSAIGNTFPKSTLDAVARVDITDAVPLKDLQGFRHVPPFVVAECLSRAIDFFYSHGELILHTIEQLFANGIELTRLEPSQIPKPLQAMGVTRWAIPANILGAKYAEELRTRPGLWDLMTVLYGASAIVVGALEALRKGEVDDLKKGDLDAENEYLMVLSRKSGFGDLRRADELPLPKAASDILSRIRNFIDAIDCQHERLFAALGKEARFHKTTASLEDHIDAFLDYIQSPKDELGRRYYLRQHQLRKFFVEVFFKCCGFAGVDTLRWFLRHLDAEHIWAYIKLSTSRGELQLHMSDAAIPLIRSGSVHMVPLIRFLRQRLRVSDFKTVSDEELRELLLDLQNDRTVEFEMVFPHASRSQEFHLGVVVWEVQ